MNEREWPREGKTNQFRGDDLEAECPPKGAMNAEANPTKPISVAPRRKSILPRPKISAPPQMSDISESSTSLGSSQPNREMMKREEKKEERKEAQRQVEQRQRKGKRESNASNGDGDSGRGDSLRSWAKSVNFPFFAIYSAHFRHFRPVLR